MTSVVCEIGLNHGGSFDKAITMIQEAKRCGVTIVKFQYYLIDILCANRDDYSSYELLKKICPKPQWIPLLKAECDRLGMEFSCTAFCKYSAEEISPYVKTFKIASPEACNLRFVKQLNQYGMPLIISTGKIDYDQIKKIRDIVDVPVTLLYCVSKYPAQPSDYHMDEFIRLQDMFSYRWQIGISDHTQGLEIAREAIREGATMIEKHFKIDNNCVDAAVSSSPTEMTQLCNLVRDWNKYR